MLRPRVPTEQRLVGFETFQRTSAFEEPWGASLFTTVSRCSGSAVWLDGEIVWVGGYGTRIPGENTPPDEETLYMIGSNTKKVTALSLLKKVESGQLTLDTTIADVLPDLEMQLAPEYENATVHQLLTHTGGIVEGSEYTTATTDAALHDYAYGEFRESYYSLLPPGVFFNYSNSNFSMAGLIDETLDYRMWPDIVTDDIFLPLGMYRTAAWRAVCI